MSDADTHFGITAELAWLEVEGAARLVEGPLIVIDASSGTISGLRLDWPHRADPTLLVHDLGRSLILPGFVNGHSHAFQRMIRGMSHRRAAPEAPGRVENFWSWRSAMYRAANSLDPDGVLAHTRACFAEMLQRGITTVGEFHYLHHDPLGRPYADPNELSRQVIRAAAEVGIRLVLLEVYYARADLDHSGPLPEQRRFCDASIDAYLNRVDDLRTSGVRVGIAPHSVRAVRAAELGALAAYADAHELPIHAHVSEQRGENEQCRAEYGRSPTQVLADAGCLARARAFTAVHAIHVDETDRALLAKHHVCACPTTEADLGDGIVPAREFLDGGTVLALGSDSNAIIDPIQEARLLEMHERLQRQARTVLADDEGRVAPVLLAAATLGGGQCLGRPELGRLAIGTPFDAAIVDLDHPSLADVPREWSLDALMLAGAAEPIRQVWIGGRRRI